MPKYLIQARYTPEGIRGLASDSASGRRADVAAAVKGVGGTIEAFYYCFGSEDVITIMDLPGNIEAAALAIAVGRGGSVHVRTTPLITVEEVDKALEVNTQYRQPGA
jgi:uncharacterized protein with GYD domain